jgi:hypothetical protein
VGQLGGWSLDTNAATTQVGVGAANRAVRSSCGVPDASRSTGLDDFRPPTKIPLPRGAKCFCSPTAEYRYGLEMVQW